MVSEGYLEAGAIKNVAGIFKTLLILLVPDHHGFPVQVGRVLKPFLPLHELAGHWCCQRGGFDRLTCCYQRGRCYLSIGLGFCSVLERDA